MTSDKQHPETVAFPNPFQTHISIYKKQDAWKAVKCEWAKDHWEATQTSPKVWEKKEDAIENAKKWAERENLPYLEK